jgi:hypothetical protein
MHPYMHYHKYKSAVNITFTALYLFLMVPGTGLEPAHP